MGAYVDGLFYDNVVLTAADLQAAQVDAISAGAAAVQSVTPSVGGAVSRTLASRFTDTMSVLDFGVVGGGAAGDTAAYQEALTACAGRCALIHPAGLTVDINASLIVSSFTHLTIDGTLFLTAGSNCHCILISNATSVLIDGIGTIDGNKAHNTSGTVNFGSGGIVTNQSSYPTLACSDITIRDLTIQNCVNWPVSLNSVSGCRVENIKALNCGSACQFAMGTTNGVFTGNTVNGDPDYGFAFYDGCSHSSCSDNIFIGVGTIGVLADGDITQAISPPNNPDPRWYGQAQHDLTIEGNHVIGATQYGVSVSSQVLNAGSAYTASYPYRVSVLNNTIENPGLANTSSNPAGILIVNASQCIVDGNVISGGGTSGDIWTGIDGGNSNFLRITNNFIISGGSVAGVTAAYAMTPFCSSSLYADNFVYGTQWGFGNGTTGGGVFPSGTTFIDNKFFSMGSGIFVAADPRGNETYFRGQLTAGSNSIYTGQPIVAAPGAASIVLPPIAPGNAQASSGVQFNSVDSSGVAHQSYVAMDSTGTMVLTASTGIIKAVEAIQGTSLTAQGGANSLTILGSVSGSPVAVQAQGSDSNVTIQLVPKGTGAVQSFGPIRPRRPVGSSSARNTGTAARRWFGCHDR
jgi:hypothetical protein